MDATPADLKSLLLAAPGRPRLAVAESMTGGRLQARITEIPGASGFFLGGVTAYALAQKVALLGVDEAHAAAVNCVSERVAGEMALGVCRLFRADIALATTGYAEPSPADGVADPFAWAALAEAAGGEPKLIRVLRVDCPGAGRTEAQARVADAALALLLERLRAR
ncbi:MAG: CinA family protein [Opitutaceae bacterium]